MKVPLFSPYEKYSIDTEGNVYKQNGEIMKSFLSTTGYINVFLCYNGKPIHKKVHRLMAQMFLPDFNEKLHVDHIDRNPLNNCIENLRMATCRQNGINRPRQKNNTSGYKGIIWVKTHKKWCAKIKYNQKNIHLGYFDNIENAREAYNTKAKELFGEFAYQQPQREKLKIKFINQSSFSSSE